jgi:hypothetical protein
MGSIKLVESGYEIDPTPETLPDGRLCSRAVVRRLSDNKTEELRPDFDPFGTEAEASSAAYIAALAWVAHQVAGRTSSQQKSNRANGSAS